jgi:hypothetical protein
MISELEKYDFSMQKANNRPSKKQTLIEYLEGRISDTESETKMYQKDRGECWVNSEELATISKTRTNELLRVLRWVTTKITEDGDVQS